MASALTGGGRLVSGVLLYLVFRVFRLWGLGFRGLGFRLRVHMQRSLKTGMNVSSIHTAGASGFDTDILVSQPRSRLRPVAT